MSKEISRRNFIRLSILTGAELLTNACTKKNTQFYEASKLMAKLREGEDTGGTATPSSEPSKTATKVVSTETPVKTKTSVPTETATSIATATEAVEPVKPTELYEMVYQRVLQIREDRRLTDPDYEKRIDWELNKDRINFLVLGMDTRGEGLKERSDAIVCLSLDTKTNTAKVISVPRDLHSPRTDVLASQSSICDCGGLPFRINATTVFGTAKDMLPIMEDITGLSQDICLVFNFNGVKEIVNAIGGVEINITQTFLDRYGGDFEAEHARDNNVMVLKLGKMVLNGPTAFWYARVRYSDDDWARDSRQREVAMGLLKKGWEVVSNEPGRFLSLVFTISELIRKKELGLVGEFGYRDIFDLAWALKDKPQVLRALEVPAMKSLNIWSGLVDSGRQDLPEQLRYPEQYQLFMNDQSVYDPPNTQEAYLAYWHEVRNRVKSLLTSKE